MPSRIMIFGCPGGGKSTVAFKLHRASGIPLHHLDKHFYDSNWVERDSQEFLSIQKAIVDEPSWIIDGNNTKSLEMRYCRADLVLYFNYPRRICYYRIFKRLFNKSAEIDDRAEGCEETVRLSLIRYMWSFERRVESKIKSLREKYPHTEFIEINSNSGLSQLENKWGLQP